MIALMFLAKERLACRDTMELPSCNDPIEIMRHKLPKKIVTDNDLANSITNRHQRRQRAKDSASRAKDKSLQRNSHGIRRSRINENMLIKRLPYSRYYRFFSTFAFTHLAPPLSLGKPMLQLRFSQITKHEQRKIG
ncbi:MAG TPA: hypothetical protein VJ001_00345 [Rhodocyclaceae bacterium]|nr:hypothetical protein [Rhodocyclaceae bacterium]